jgi:hypothetical protein
MGLAQLLSLLILLPIPGQGYGFLFSHGIRLGLGSPVSCSRQGFSQPCSRRRRPPAAGLQPRHRLRLWALAIVRRPLGPWPRAAPARRGYGSPATVRGPPVRRAPEGPNSGAGEQLRASGLRPPSARARTEPLRRLRASAAHCSGAPPAVRRPLGLGASDRAAPRLRRAVRRSPDGPRRRAGAAPHLSPPSARPEHAPLPLCLRSPVEPLSACPCPSVRRAAVPSGFAVRRADPSASATRRPPSFRRPPSHT